MDTQHRTQPRRSLLQASRAGLLVLVGLAAGCNGCSQDPMEDPTFKVHTLMDWVRSAEGVSSPPTTGRVAPVLYIDASASMRGFADRDGQFEYSCALRALADVADQPDLAQPLRVRRIDTTVRDLPDATQALAAASRSAGFYTGSSSDIAATIRSFAAITATPASRPGQVDIFITDGVQSLPHSSKDPRCAGGADPRCVNAAIGSLIDKGWGAHIFGIRSRFSGPVYSETLGGAPAGTYQAVNPADTARFRPFLMFVFAERREQLEGLVDRLREKLGDRGVGADLIRELPLTLPLVKAAKLHLDTSGYAVHDELGGSAPKPNPLNLGIADLWRLDSKRQPLRDDVQILSYAWKNIDFLDPCAVRITADLTLTAAGRAIFGSGGSEAAAALLRFTAREIARPKEWYPSPQGLAWPPVGYQLKHLQFDGDLTDGLSEPLLWRGAGGKMASAGAAGGHLVLRWSQSGDYLPITLVRVEGRLDPAGIFLPPWTAAWSTNDDSSPASANRLLNLEALVHGLLHNSHLATQGLGPWYLVIKPKKS